MAAIKSFKQVFYVENLVTIRARAKNHLSGIYLKSDFQQLSLVRKQPIVMGNPPLLFLAEDDEDDRMLFLEALTEINPAIKCLVAKNGKEALLILQNDLFELPDYIFLDLNMPVMDGLKCLAEIKKTARLKDIPLFIYSTSNETKFIEESKKLGAMNFFVKPHDFGGLIQFLKKILE